MRARQFHIAGLVLATLVSGCTSVTQSSRLQAPVVANGEGIAPDAAPYALSLGELLNWTPDGKTADPRNVSTVPLAQRFVDPATDLDREARVLYAPDGINNFGNYLTAQPKFNLYTFTHWSRIDVLNWFSGARTVNLPSRPWVEAAHRNGVKVIGTVFFAPVVYGGRAEDIDALLVQGANDSFPAADRLIEIAEHYGFDGWLMNQETDLLEVLKGGKVTSDPGRTKGAEITAAKLRDFMAYLTAKAPPGMEVHWYDSMLPDGRVDWQNALNDRNAPFLQTGLTRTSDAIFLNYWWNKDRIDGSKVTAEALGRSRYDVFFGADLWPARTINQAAFRNTHWLAELFDADGKKASGSIALFAPNFNFDSFNDQPKLRMSRFRDDPADVQSFYDAEIRLFGGDDRNVLATGQGPHSAAWDGLARYIPVRSPISSAPFSTSFNTGHGAARYQQGKQVGGAWHDMAQQDVQPQFLFGWEGRSTVKASFDFDSAYDGGSSVRIERHGGTGDEAIVPLFLTRIAIDDRRELSVTYRSSACGQAEVELRLSNDAKLQFPLKAGVADWLTVNMPVNQLNGATINSVAIRMADGSHQCTASSKQTLQLGRLSIH